MSRRYAHQRVDANHRAVIEALWAAGLWAFSTAGLGGGFTDIITWVRGAFWLLEVKDGSRPPSDRKLSPAEEKFHRQCPGNILVVLGPMDALQKLGVAP